MKCVLPAAITGVDEVRKVLFVAYSSKVNIGDLLNAGIQAEFP